MSDSILKLVPDELRRIGAYEVPRPAGVRAKLDANEHPFPLPPEVSEALARELAEVELNRYPDAGCAELRALLAAEHQIEEGAIVFGNGSDELLHLLCAVFARPRSPGARPAILYPAPTFSVFRIAAIGVGLEPVEVPLTESFELDEAALERSLSERRPNVAFFARPNNPTGTLWPSATVARLARRHPDVLFVSDEAYGDYGGESALPLLKELPNLVVLRTLSKIGLAALRVGYLVAAPELAAEVNKVRGPYNVGSLNQRAACFLLARHRELLRGRCAEVVSERERMAEEMGRLSGVRVFPSQANLLLFRVGDPESGAATRLWRRLVEQGILVRNLDTPGPLAGCLRVTIGTPEENRLFLEALEEALGEL